MPKLLKALMVVADEYSVVDFGALKIAMMMLGLILGIYFSTYLVRWMPLIVVIFIITYVYIVVRTLIGVKKNEKKVKIKRK